jgi:hypothetical protein
MVFVRYNGSFIPMVTGPLMTSGVVSYTEGAEIIWVKFKLGTFMPHLPHKKILDREINLPEAGSQSFWLHSSTWQFPDHNNVDTFIDRLGRDEVLVHDPLVNAVLQDHPQEMSPRTVRHRFLQATGISQTHIRQIERAKRAASLLQQGVSILDTVYELGYYDQPHLTRSLKQWIGYTPAQILHGIKPE